MNLMKKESDSESDELLNLLMQDPVKQEEERLAQEEESQRRRQELEKDAAISSFLQALKKRRCENGIDKDSSDAGREEQEEAGRKGQECPLWDERNLKRELLSFQSQVPRGWMTIDHCVRVDLKQVDDHKAFLRRCRLNLLDIVASLRDHEKMFYFGIAAYPGSRAINKNIGHLRRFKAMYILAYCPSRIMGDMEDFLIKYSWMQPDAEKCLNQVAGRGGQGTKMMAGYCYLVEREETENDEDLRYKPARQLFLKNEADMEKIWAMSN